MDGVSGLKALGVRELNYKLYGVWLPDIIKKLTKIKN